MADADVIIETRVPSPGGRMLGVRAMPADGGTGMWCGVPVDEYTPEVERELAVRAASKVPFRG